MVKSSFKRNEEDNEMRSAKIIAFVHHKGGTGKTTSCINIAGWLVKMKKKVLVVDLDPQGNATAGLGIDRKSLNSSIYDVLFGPQNIKEVIIETDSGVYLAPSSLDLLAAETHMAGQINNTRLLKSNLYEIEELFDYILIDVPPGSTLLMINGIVASKDIIIPLDSGIFAFETMETLKTLLLDLSKELGIEVNVIKVLLKGYSSLIFDKAITREIRKMLKDFLNANLTMDMKISTIPISRKIYKAQMRGMPISHYAPYSDVGRVYRRIAKEIIKS